MIQTFTHPKGCNFANEIRLTVNDHPVEVLRTETADFANFIYDPVDGDARIVVLYLDRAQVERVVIRPRARPLVADVHPDGFTFTIHRPEKCSLEVSGRRPLFLWANPPEEDRPDPDDPDVIWLKAGQVHEAATFSLESGQTLYLEGGAVLRGSLRVNHARNVIIRGHGILDGSYYRKELGNIQHLARLYRCEQVTVRDITMIHPSGWMLVPAASRNIHIENIKQIGEVVSSDGIDITGCTRVHIRDCFLQNNDDCVVIKAFEIGKLNQNPDPVDGRENVEDILIESCILLNAHAGNAMEIGHELNVESVRNVTFRDIDVLSVHGNGAVFSIHNYGQALVENITFENIRIEHCYDKFLDLRISRSRYSVGDSTGRIRNVTFRNIDWHREICSHGYTVSLISGWSPEADIQDIHFENIRINGTPIQNLDELEIAHRYAKRIELR